MYESFFELEDVRREHASHPMAAQLDRYSKNLLGKGYQVGSVVNWLYRWEAFLSWLGKEKLPVTKVDEQTVASFVERQCKRRRWRGRKIAASHVVKSHRPALKHLLRFMREEDLIPAPVTLRVTPWHTPHMKEWAAFLRSHGGLSASIVDQRCREARYYLESLAVSSWPEALCRMNPASIDAFLLQRAGYLKRSSQALVCGSLRAFFRYLYTSGQVAADLVSFVSCVRQYKLATLPKWLDWADVQKILRAVKQDTPRGLRNYAAFLLMATYGLRASEATSLRLEDIDWRNSQFHIRHGKTGRDNILPLAPEVGDALIAYLERGRPPSEHRVIFLRIPAPHSPLSCGGVLRFQLQKALATAGFGSRRLGLHTFRHSVATYLLQQGRTLKTIGDLLGHRDPASTCVYAKVHIEALREVALDVEVYG